MKPGAGQKNKSVGRSKNKALGADTAGNPAEVISSQFSNNFYQAKKYYLEGKKYLTGKGVPYSVEKAFEYFSEACTKDPSKISIYSN